MPADFNWTPDELLLVADLVRSTGWTAVRADTDDARQLSELLRQAPFHPVDGRPENFRSPDSIQRKSYDLVTAHPSYSGKKTRGGEATRLIAERYAQSPDELATVAATIRSGLEQSQITSDELAQVEYDEGVSAVEGALLRALRAKRERNPALRAKKIEHSLGRHGRLACEVCDFDFHATYGERGRQYIEVHHVVPLHRSGVTTTALRDLGLLCANCHRMIHRGTVSVTPTDLRLEMAQANPASSSDPDPLAAAPTHHS